jgi:hypothetical protein
MTSENFDPYREALVVEIDTLWPDGLDANLGPDQQRRIAERLHADPRHAARLEYVRLHTGFCRKITVTAEDLQRLK